MLTQETPQEELSVRTCTLFHIYYTLDGTVCFMISNFEMLLFFLSVFNVIASVCDGSLKYRMFDLEGNNIF